MNYQPIKCERHCEPASLYWRAKQSGISATKIGGSAAHFGGKPRLLRSLRSLAMTALLFFSVSNLLFAEYSEDFKPITSKDPEVEQGCNIAWEIGRGYRSEAELTPDERIALGLLKQDSTRYSQCTGKYYSKKSSRASSSFSSSSSYTNDPYQEKVVQVIDLNTLGLSKGQKIELIGVKPKPEANAEGIPFLRKLVLNQNIKLEYDQERRDRFNRLMAYVFLMDGTFVNRAVIKAGHAEAEIVPPNTAYQRNLLGLDETKEDSFKEEIPAVKTPLQEEDDFVGAVTDFENGGTPAIQRASREVTEKYFRGIAIALGLLILFVWIRNKFLM